MWKKGRVIFPHFKLEQLKGIYHSGEKRWKRRGKFRCRLEEEVCVRQSVAGLWISMQQRCARGRWTQSLELRGVSWAEGHGVALSVEVTTVCLPGIASRMHRLGREQGKQRRVKTA